MSKGGLSTILESIRDELTVAEVKAKDIHSHLQFLIREAEFTKILVIEFYIEKQKESVARDKGFTYLFKEKSRLRDSLIFAAGSFVFGRLLTKDKYGALTAGVSGFDGMVRGFGESKWCVLLGYSISIVPEGTISTQVPRISLGYFYETMEELKKGALSGKKVGEFDDIISKLMKKPERSQQ